MSANSTSARRGRRGAGRRSGEAARRRISGSSSGRPSAWRWWRTPRRARRRRRRRSSGPAPAQASSTGLARGAEADHPDGDVLLLHLLADVGEAVLDGLGEREGRPGCQRRWSSGSMPVGRIGEVARRGLAVGQEDHVPRARAGRARGRRSRPRTARSARAAARPRSCRCRGRSARSAPASRDRRTSSDWVIVASLRAGAGHAARPMTSGLTYSSVVTFWFLLKPPVPSYIIDRA